MDQQRSLTLHYLLRAGILAAFSFLIVRFVRADRLYYYIAPRTETIVKLAALGLFVVAVFQAYLALQSYYNRKEGVDGHLHDQSCGCSHPPPASKRKSITLYGLFAIPLLLGFLTPDTLMGSSLTALKGVNLSSSASVQQNVSSVGSAGDETGSGSSRPEGGGDGLAAGQADDEASGTGSDTPAGIIRNPSDAAGANADPLDALFPYDTYTELHAQLAKKLYRQDVIPIREEGFMEILTTLDLYKQSFAGKEVTISGYVYREEGMRADQFIVSRLAMQCCSADTEPYGVLAASPDAAALEADTWVSLKGVIGLTNYLGMEIMELQISELNEIEPPDSPYVYPDDAYFEQLLNE